MREILVDDRVGSRELIPHLEAFRLPVRKQRLEFADVAFVGNGKSGEVKIGVERKVVSDLINSMTSGRLSAHQLPGLVKNYDFRWVLVEGLMRPGRDNVIEVWRRGVWMPARTQLAYSQLSGYLTSLEINGGCLIKRTMGIQESANEIGLLFKWWGKDWERHRAHLAIEKGVMPDRVLFNRVSYPRLVAAVLPGIGWKKSKAVAKHFKTIEAMANARPQDWAQIEGVGRKLSVTLPMLISGMRGRGLDGSRED